MIAGVMIAGVAASLSASGPTGPIGPAESSDPRLVASAVDCDNNGIDDGLQLDAPASVIDEFSITTPGPPIFSYTPAATPLVNGAVWIEITAAGDFDQPEDTLEVAVNGEVLGVLFGKDHACGPRTETVVIPQKPFNDTVRAGPVTVQISSAFSVGPDCGVNAVSVRMIMPVQADCDFNGVLDTCQIADDPGLDDDGDGVLDICQLDCAVDLNESGAVTALDLAILLSQWNGPGPADFDGDGVVNQIDLAMLFANWGPCP